MTLLTLMALGLIHNGFDAQCVDISDSEKHLIVKGKYVTLRLVWKWENREVWGVMVQGEQTQYSFYGTFKDVFDIAKSVMESIERNDSNSTTL